MSDWGKKVDTFIVGFEYELKKLTEQHKKDVAAINQKLSDLEKRIAQSNRK